MERNLDGLFLFMTDSVRILSASVLFLWTSLIAQPQWVVTQRLDQANEFYYGIGASLVSEGDADARALIAFGQNVEVRVRSIFQREVSEEGSSFSDRTSVSAELVSDVSLKGIGVSERYTDTSSHRFYSLVRYRKTEYDSLITYEIQREILLMQARNRMAEEKREEELRAQKTLHKQDEERRKEDLRRQQARLEMEKEEQRQEEEKRTLYRTMYGEFLDAGTTQRVVTMRNGEVSGTGRTLMLKGHLNPLAPAEAFYAFRLAMFELSAGVHVRAKKVQRQEAALRVQLLPGVGELTRTTLSIGVSQGLASIADSGYAFDRSVLSFFAAGDYTDPEWNFTTLSFYADRRYAAVGAVSFPFYKQFKDHVGFMLEAKYIFHEDFRDERGAPFELNAGIMLRAGPEFSTTLTLEDHRRIALAFEFQF